MNYTQEQIKAKANQALKDINDQYFYEEMIESIVFDLNTDFSVNGTLYTDHPRWLVYIKTIFDNTAIIAISDKTGEPIYYRTSGNISKIIRDANGKYYKTRN